jgi:hypothetical protein
MWQAEDTSLAEGWLLRRWFRALKIKTPALKWVTGRAGEFHRYSLFFA